MICKYLEGTTCRVISILSDMTCTTDDQICGACQNAVNPCNVNNITVSMAVDKLQKAGMLDKAREVYTSNIDIMYSKPEDINIECANRMQSIGYADCNCQGNVNLYACKIHGECMHKRVTLPEPNIVYFNGEHKTKHVKYCNQCDDII